MISFASWADGAIVSSTSGSRRRATVTRAPRAFDTLRQLFLLALLAPVLAAAQDRFVVADIRLEGLQRISAGTVFNYLPIQVGDTVDAERTAEAIRALFGTGFFNDVRIERDGDTLVVSVAERPSIASIALSGNDTLETEALLESLRNVGFAEGRVFDRSVFEQVEQEIRRTYFAVGKYGVRITSTITPLERNRVAINFDISEGEAATIKQINIVGNAVFDDDDLTDLFTLQITSWYSVFTKSDQYSKEKLSADLETLRSHYLDRGYINFNIDSTQVSITPDKRDVYITVNVTEGEQFGIGEVVLAGELLVDREELFPMVVVQRGDVFSRKDVTETTAKLTERLGQEGYAFANVNAVPEIDEASRTVKITFFIDPGKRVYVRRVSFRGNTKTRDEVLRREMRQLEGAWISTGAVERSKVRLDRLGYFEEVNVETPAVPGTTDQVDVEFNVVEAPSGNLTVGAGYSQGDGFVLASSVTQDNVFGTGHRLTINLNTSSVNRNIGFSWLNPYFTLDGVSLGVDVYWRTTDANNANVADYTLDQFGGGFSLGIPVTEFNYVNLGLNAENTKFKPGGGASEEVLEFAQETGGEFNTLTVSAGWSNDSRNSRLFPNRGAFTRLGAEMAIPGLDLSFYKVTARHQRFIPLLNDITLMVNGDLGYGDGLGDTDDLPLTDNFFAGGIRSVRGFEDNTLGPRDSLGEPLGGSLKVVGNLELILPVPFVGDSRNFRLTGFFDIGNVFGPDESFAVDDLRYSLGLSAVWLSPLGPLTISVAAPLKSEDEDDEQPLQFTFGTTF
jgi:outer membrane protein insertion porin family